MKMKGSMLIFELITTYLQLLEIQTNNNKLLQKSFNNKIIFPKFIKV